MKISLATGQNGFRILPDVANGERIHANFNEEIEVLADGKPPTAVQPTPDGGMALMWQDGSFIVLENEAAEPAREVSINGQLFAVGGGGEDNANSGSYMDWTANYNDSPLHFEPLGPYTTSFSLRQEAATGTIEEPQAPATEPETVTLQVNVPPPPPVDLPPIAIPDTNWIFEDGPDASGNVLADNPHIGSPFGIFKDVADVDPDAQTLGVATVNGNPANIGLPVAGGFGMLTLTRNGNYSYVLNNANPEVQGLSRGDTLTDTFTYTATDGNNETTTVTLTITIFGTDDGAIISDIGASGGDEIVYEHDLPDGSAPDATALAQHGTFNIMAPDGISTMRIGSTVLTIAEIQALGTTPVTLTSATGELVLHGFTGTIAGGTIDYTYTLLNSLAHPTADGENHVIDAFPVLLTDEDGSTDSSSLTVKIVDDVATAVNDSNGTATEGNVTLTGNVLANDVQGADGAAVTPASLTGTYGSIVIAANGGYTYTLDPLDADFAALTGGGTANEVFQYTITDADGHFYREPSRLHPTCRLAQTRRRRERREQTLWQ